MEIKYSKVSQTIPKKCFKIEIEYEHGDADSQNTDTVTLKDCSEVDFIEYVKKFDELKEMINHSRSYGEELPDDFESMCKVGKYYIPVELDAYAKMHMSGYYANMRINSISYFNENGEEFLVEIK
jgi:negative regulator of genetic competence, sporulation and motility